MPLLEAQRAVFAGVVEKCMVKGHQHPMHAQHGMPSSAALTSSAQDHGGTTWWSCTSLKLRIALMLDVSSRVCMQGRARQCKVRAGAEQHAVAG
jgi:hypothetical protein